MFFHQRFIPGLAIASYMVGDEKTKELLRELAKLNPEDPRAELFKNV